MRRDESNGEVAQPVATVVVGWRTRALLACPGGQLLRPATETHLHDGRRRALAGRAT